MHLVTLNHAQKCIRRRKDFWLAGFAGNEDEKEKEKKRKRHPDVR